MKHTSIILAVFVAIGVFMSLAPINGFIDNFVEIYSQKESGSSTPDEIRELASIAYVNFVGKSASGLAILFTSLSLLIGLASSTLRNAFIAIAATLLIGTIFCLSSYTFILSDTAISFISDSSKYSMVEHIVKAKIASIVVGLTSGGLLYDNLKALAGISKEETQPVE